MRLIITLSILWAGILYAADPALTLVLSQSLNDLPLPPLVQVKIDQTDISMILDTGTPNVLVLDPIHAAKIHWSEKSDSFTVAGGMTIRRQLGHVPQVTLGTCRVLNSRAVELDLQSFRDYTGMPYYGIVPVSFARGHILKFDFDASVVQLIDGKIATPSDWAVLPLDIHEGSPHVHLKIHDEEILFLIDTGFNGVCDLPAQSVRRLLAQDHILLNSVKGKGVDAAGSVEGNTSGWFKQGTLMGKSLTGVEWTSSQADAKLGMGWLLGFNFMIDMNELKFYHQLRKKPHAPVALDLMIGAAFRYTNAGLVVERLRPGGGAAEAAGLKVGDVIFSLGAAPDLPLDGPHVYDVVEKSAGKKLPCVYRRAGSTKPFHVEIEVGKVESAWNFGGYRSN
jgi:hypothetical protein